MKEGTSQQKRCFICLKTGHMLKQCPSLHKRACYCGKRNSHNRCLCPEKFAAQQAESFVVTGQDHNSDDLLVLTCLLLKALFNYNS